LCINLPRPLLDAFGSSSRLALLRCLEEAPGSSAPELAQASGLHINTVRTHLRGLEADGAVQSEPERRERRGRPTIRYRLRAPVVPGADLLPLTSVLAGTLTSLGPDAEAACEEHGLEWGRRWSRLRASESPVERLRSALERLGFAVALDGEDLRLGQCPCPLVAGSSPALVCGLADAVTDGVLDGTSVAVSRRSHDPKRRRCTITLLARG